MTRLLDKAYDIFVWILLFLIMAIVIGVVAGCLLLVLVWIKSVFMLWSWLY